MKWNDASMYLFCLAHGKHLAHMGLLPFYLGLDIASLFQVLYEAEFQSCTHKIPIL